MIHFWRWQTWREKARPNASTQGIINNNDNERHLSCIVFTFIIITTIQAVVSFNLIGTNKRSLQRKLSTQLCKVNNLFGKKLVLFARSDAATEEIKGVNDNVDEPNDQMNWMNQMNQMKLTISLVDITWTP